MTSLKFKKGDVVRFTKERVELARHRFGHDARIVPKWDDFVLSHINLPLTVKYVHDKTGNHEPFQMIILDTEEIKGYWNQDAFEFYNNFDEGLFKV